MSQISLYDRSNIDTLDWPGDINGRYAKRVFRPLIENGTLTYIDNVDVNIFLLLVDRHVFPLIPGNLTPRVKNSYVCSTTTHYIDYAIEEFDIELKDKPWLKKLGIPLLKGLGLLFQKMAFEKVLFVNNWLLSTNLYPDFDLTDLESIRDFLLHHFPDRALIFRSVNDRLNWALLNQLKQVGFDEVLSRQVYIFDPAKGISTQKGFHLKDLKLKKRTAYQWKDASEIQEKDIPRLKALYDDLYLKKYSLFNPQFNETFFREALANEWMRFFILTKEDQIDAVIGYFERDGVMTTPMVGYDRSVSRSEGLFRLLSLKLLEEAIAHQWMLHQSSGVSQFKQQRGGEPSLEYNLVYYHHLHPKNRIPWQILKELSADFMVPLVRKYQL